MFAKLLAFIMADVGECDAAFGTLEIVIFHVTGKVDVGLLADSVVDEETARTTADGDTTDNRSGDVADAQKWQAESEFHLLEKCGGWHGVG